MVDKSSERLRQFFSPEHIAVIGASDNNQWFFNLIGNAARIAFQGRFYPVNPRAEEVCGLKAYQSIYQLPEGIIDFAVIMVKSTLVLDALRELKDRGILNVLLISSGFAETGDEGRLLQSEVREYCSENNMLLMGPNCLGFMNLAAKTTIFLGGAVEGDLVAGNIGLIGQSGAASEVMASKLMLKSPGLSLYATTGNEALLTAEDCLEYLIEDNSTRVITAFMESLRDVDKLKNLARAAAEKKIPLIFIKVGRSETGKKAAMSHTGALAGDDGIAEGLFRQLGIIRVESIEELVETAGLFSRQALPEGGGLGICTLSGGLCGLYADLCHTYGINLPPLQEHTRKSLKAYLPPFAVADNPLDVTGAGFQGGFREILEILINDDNLHIILPVCIPPLGELDRFSHMINEAFLSLAGTTRKLLVPITFREMTAFAKDLFHSRGISYIEHPEMGFRALSHMIRYASFLKRFHAEEGVSLDEW